MSNRYSPPVNRPGLKVSACERSSSPAYLRVAQRRDSADRREMLRGEPGLVALRAELRTAIFRPVTAASATAVRTSWPPPSPYDPSISSMPLIRRDLVWGLTMTAGRASRSLLWLRVSRRSSNKGIDVALKDEGLAAGNSAR